MRNYISLLIVFISFTTFSQAVYVEAGKTDSTFEFTNSAGEELENLQHSMHNYVRAGYKRSFFTENFNVSLGLGYNSYGAIGSTDILNNFFEWDVDYLGIDLSLDYDLVNFNDFVFFLKASASLEFLVQGTQTINNRVINLTDVEEFDDNAIFLRGGAGFSYPISERSRMYIQYSYGSSLAMNDDNGDSTSSEELKIKTHMVGIGLVVSIFPKQHEEDVEVEIENDTDTE
jgi:hypothetical protein